MREILPYLIPGLLYGIATLGLGIILRYCKFPDLTVLGSLILSGVICIWVTNQAPPIVGLLAGALSAGVLGWITAKVSMRFAIQPVLAGIITMTGTTSIAYFVTGTGGQIDLDDPNSSLLSADYTMRSLLIISALALLLCCFLAFIFKTHVGSLILAMTGSSDYKKFRHTRYKSMFSFVLILGNLMVGIAGALYAMRDRSAAVVDHQTFLHLGLGAVFGGNALAYLVSKWVDSKRLEHEVEQEELDKKGRKSLIARIRGSMGADRDDSQRMFILAMSYVIGCFFLHVISGIVNTRAIGKRLPWLDFNPESHYLVVAVLTLIAVWWAKEDQGEN